MPDLSAATNGQLTGFSGKLNRGPDNGRASYNAIYLQLEKPFTDLTTWGFTEAITLQRAKTNVAQELNSDEFFNGAALRTLWLEPRQRRSEVETGHVGELSRALRTSSLSGILTLLRSGVRQHRRAVEWQLAAPDGACCLRQLRRRVLPEEDRSAYKRLDLRVAKTFKMPWGHEAHGRLRGVQRLQLAQPHLLDVGRRSRQPAAAQRERPGRQRPAPVPGRPKYKF